MIGLRRVARLVQFFVDFRQTLVANLGIPFLEFLPQRPVFALPRSIFSTPRVVGPLELRKRAAQHLLVPQAICAKYGIFGYIVGDRAQGGG